MKYNWRIIDDVLRDRLDYAGAVLVQGAKWCGKTTSCEQVAKSALDTRRVLSALRREKIRRGQALKMHVCLGFA